MRLIFLGSGEFAVPALEALGHSQHTVAAVVTQPDRPKGRGRILAPPPVKPVAEALGIPVRQPAKIKETPLVEELTALRPDALAVVAYGQILPKSLIALAPLGAINVHASLLPRYRGAAPVQWAIASGESETGVTTMLIDEGLDTGPVLLSERVTIGDDETAPELEARLATLGAALLLRTLEGLAASSIGPTPQDHASATYAPLLHKQDGMIDWTSEATSVWRRVRAFARWPGCATRIKGRTLKVLKARPAGRGEGQPGRITLLDGGVLVSCGSGSQLWILEVQPENRPAMPASSFARGARLATGDSFE
jgi:methionyl-tRNA formyltransferase